MSYTVVCSGLNGTQNGLVISFREPGARLDGAMVKLAKEIHGELVPESGYHMDMAGSDPPISVYSMPFLRGESYIEVLHCKTVPDAGMEVKHVSFSNQLARYFAQCWTNPQPTNKQIQKLQHEGIQKRLTKLKGDPSSSTPLNLVLFTLIEGLPSLFSELYRQVLTHNDLSVTNILVDESTFNITGVVDWSLASVMPFGMDLDILYLSTGFMTLDGWHNYACKQLLRDTLWEEFWLVSGVKGGYNRSRIRDLAEITGKIGAIIRLTFHRNAHGSPSEDILAAESRRKQLNSWFSE